MPRAQRVNCPQSTRFSFSSVLCLYSIEIEIVCKKVLTMSLRDLFQTIPAPKRRNLFETIFMGLFNAPVMEDICIYFDCRL